MLEDVLAFAALPLAAAVIFTGIHTWLGLQVLRRNVVFADLALAQVSALGATVAVVAGHAVSSAAGYAYTLIFAASAALLLTASRGLARSVRQEAFIGVLYVVATAATVLVVDRSPQGAEQVKKMLVGGILSVTADEVCQIRRALCRYRRPALDDPAAVAGRCRQRRDARGRRTGGTLGPRFLSVVRRSGDVLGQPCRRALGILLSDRSGASGDAVLRAHRHSACHRLDRRCDCQRGRDLGSFLIDAPTGALTVVAFAVVLIAAGAVRAFMTAPADERTRNRKRGIPRERSDPVRGGRLVRPVGDFAAGDHPLLAAIEVATGIGPEKFMTTRERADYLEAMAVERRHRSEVDRLYEIERKSRWQGDAMSADDIRRIGSVQQTLTEMGRGERFVMDYLRTRARERGRWYVGLPLAAFGFLALPASPGRCAARLDQACGLQ